MKQDEKIALQSAGIKVEDMSQYYARYKDLNDYHIAQCKQEQKEVQQRKPVIVKHKIR